LLYLLDFCVIYIYYKLRSNLYPETFLLQLALNIIYHSETYKFTESIMPNCPCGSNISYSDCCEPAHTGKTPSKTAEALMRSRYSAYVKNCIPYLGDSLHPDQQKDWSEADTKRWAEQSEWLSLEIVSTDAGKQSDEFGTVEFIAAYKEKDQIKRHHEISQFQKIDEHWYYVDGAAPKIETVVNSSPKVGRNDPCPCGSGKKYKKCCK